MKTKTTKSKTVSIVENQNPASVKINNGFIYLPKTLTRVMGLGRISFVQFQKIQGSWFITKSNRFGIGGKIVRWNKQARLYGSYVENLSKLMIGDSPKPFYIEVNLNPVANQDGRNYYQVRIKNSDSESTTTNHSISPEYSQAA